MNKSLADFAQNPLEYDISEMMGEDEITDMAYQVEMLRQELYEASGRNRNYHVKAEDVKHLLPDLSLIHISEKRYRELISCAHGGWYQDDVIFEPLAEHFVANHLFDELRFLCERGIRFSAEDMLATIKSEKEEHGALDIETIRSIDVPSYVSGRSYSHLGEIAKYRGVDGKQSFDDLGLEIQQNLFGKNKMFQRGDFGGRIGIGLSIHSVYILSLIHI